MLPTPEQQLDRVNQGTILSLNVLEVVDASVLLCSLWSEENMVLVNTEGSLLRGSIC